ncbi:endonuclease domain-containing protein [Arthrobacter sulfonylureivorans]|uniref:endonuclease domain-containing protein n=1 Tax=Arthrobacter sulfonylureivorans TaxID=2486855 RepID=UPI0039E48A0B
MQRDGVVGHRSRMLPGEVTVVDGVFLTTRARTWLDLAGKLGLDDLVVITDHLIRRPRPEFEGRLEPFATKVELQAILDLHPGKRGLRKARRALALSRVGADSPPETRLRLAMARAGLPEPAVNQPIRNDDGDILHSPDLSLPEYRIAIEYDGDGHGESGQIARDIDREERVRAADWDEVRISNRHMANGARRAVQKIAAALRARGWSQDNAA